MAKKTYSYGDVLCGCTSTKAIVWSALVLQSCALKVTKYSSSLAERQDDNRTVPILITNNCADTMWPGIWTQYGGGPLESGHELGPGEQAEHKVSSDWQGRVWARTNCSFASDGTVGPDATYGGNKACETGDCGGILDCKITGETPVTLAEFNMDGGDGLTYYDISLVDGYNIPMAIVLLPLGNSSLEDIPPNLTNPSCQGTAGLLAPADENPYNGKDGQYYLGTNSTYPLPFDTTVTETQVSKWCPWNLQLTPPEKPGDGVYPYPDDNIQRPDFNPCYSACAKWNKPADCCTGSHDSSSTCSPSEYSHAAKKICPDAYSYAFDDETSTFAAPVGAGYEVMFCPGARSTNILATSQKVLNQLAAEGRMMDPSRLNITTTSRAAANGRPRNWTCQVLALTILSVFLMSHA